MLDDALLLDENQYCHVVDNSTGAARLVVGPTRLRLEANEALRGDVQPKVVLRTNQYCYIENPFSEERGRLRDGEVELRKGPCTFPLYPGETVRGAIENAVLLTSREGLLIRVVHPTETRSAGDRYVLKGPASYIPDVTEEIEDVFSAVSLDNESGVYVKDLSTGVVRLERGPKLLFLEAYEEPFIKNVSRAMAEALGLAPDRDRSRAISLRLEHGQFCQIYDAANRRVVEGPQFVMLEPDEHFTVMELSSDAPHQKEKRKTVTLNLGPGFIYDELNVRSKDNAQLRIGVTYRWRQRKDGDLHRAFTVRDPVRDACDAIAAEVRGEAAQHDFDKLHADANAIIRRVVFGSSEAEVRNFEDTGMQIFSIDVKEVMPTDGEITQKLNETIKANIDIVLERERDLAKLEADRRKIEAQKTLEIERRDLIEIEAKNVEIQRLLEVATKNQIRLKEAETEARAISIESEASINAEAGRIAKIAEILGGAGGRGYLDLMRVSQIQKAEKMLVVPTDSKLELSLDRLPRSTRLNEGK